MEKKSLLKNKKFYWAVGLGLFILFLIAINISNITGFLAKCWNLIGLILIASAIAFILNVLIDFFSNRVLRFISHEKLKTSLSLVLALLVVVLLLVAVVAIVVPQLINSFSLLASRIPVVLDGIRAFFERFPQIKDAMSSIEMTGKSTDSSLTSFIKEVLPKTLDSTYSLALGTYRGVINVGMILLLAIYILIFKKSLAALGRRACYGYLSLEHANRVLYIFHLLDKYFRAFIYGRVVDALCLGILYAIPAFLFRLPYTLMLTTLFAVFSVIPLFGALISWVIGLFLIIPVNLTQAVIFTVIFVIILLVTRNIIYPKVIGKSLGLPEFWVLFAVIIGGKLFGLAGMLTAVPVFALLYTIFIEGIKRRRDQSSESIPEIDQIPDWSKYDPETFMFSDQKQKAKKEKTNNE